MPLQWAAVDARTGSLLADLTDISIDGPLKKTIGRYETVSATLAIGGQDNAEPPENWRRATLHGGANLIALDPDTNLPLWGGMVMQRTSGEGDTVSLSLATLEAYFDRRFVGTVSYSAVDQNFIAADLVNRFVLDGAGGKNGLPIRVQYTTGGPTRSIVYYDYNDVTVYSALQSLMGLLGGPEWSLEWEWQHNPERITPVLIIGGAGGSNRVGVSPPAGLQPNAQFSLPGCVKKLEVVEDYSAGKGGNVVTAIASGNGIARPTSGPQTMTDPSRPAFEYRYSPNQSTLVPLTLQQYAQQALAVIGNGTTTVTLDADLSTAPKLGRDWLVGDDILYDVADTVPAFPGGLLGTARSIGFSLTDEATPVLSPTLLAPAVYSGI